jgi:tRNA(Ile)-lysidine synthase
MPRSHPPTLVTLAHRAIRDERLFGRGDLVVCACSGGPDSTALLHALALLRRRLGHDLVAVGVDHGLRPEASQELELAEAVARSAGIPFRVRTVAVAPGGNLMSRAREARHRALQDEATEAGGACVALGHTADDRAETLLLRLLRGAGPKGLAVMPARAPSPFGGVDLVRPIVGARREAVRLHLERHELASARDPTNGDARFLRARVRAELLPLLEGLAPGAVDHLCHLADMLRDDGLEGLDGLGRAQRLAVRRAARVGRRSTTVRLSGGHDVTLTFSKNSPVLPDDP